MKKTTLHMTFKKPIDKKTLNVYLKNLSPLKKLSNKLNYTKSIEDDEKMFHLVPYVLIKKKNLKNMRILKRIKIKLSPKFSINDILKKKPKVQRQRKQKMICDICNETFDKMFVFKAHELHHTQPSQIIIRVQRNDFSHYFQENRPTEVCSLPEIKTQCVEDVSENIAKLINGINNNSEELGNDQLEQIDPPISNGHREEIEPMEHTDINEYSKQDTNTENIKQIEDIVQNEHIAYVEQNENKEQIEDIKQSEYVEQNEDVQQNENIIQNENIEHIEHVAQNGHIEQNEEYISQNGLRELNGHAEQPLDAIVLENQTKIPETTNSSLFKIRFSSNLEETEAVQGNDEMSL